MEVSVPKQFPPLNSGAITYNEHRSESSLTNTNKTNTAISDVTLLTRIEKVEALLEQLVRGKVTNSIVSNDNDATDASSLGNAGIDEVDGSQTFSSEDDLWKEVQNLRRELAKARETREDDNHCSSLQEGLNTSEKETSKKMRRKLKSLLRIRKPKKSK